MLRKQWSSLALAVMLIVWISSCSKESDDSANNDNTSQNTKQQDDSQSNPLGNALTQAANTANAVTKKSGDVLKQATDQLNDAAGKIQDGLKTVSLPNQDGIPVDLSAFKDKIVVLEWTNPSCPYVKRHYETGTMAKLAHDYKDKGVVWLAVNSTASSTQAQNKEWHNRYELSYPILEDVEGVLGKLLGAKTTPHMFVLNMSGQIAYSGAIDDDPQGEKGESAINYVKTVLDDLLKGNKPSVAASKPYGCSVKYAN